MHKRGKSISIILLLVLSLIFTISLSLSSKQVNADQVCCERTTGGSPSFCDYVEESQCAEDAQRAPTSCDQTSFCKTQCCVGNDGYCYDNQPLGLCQSQSGRSYDGTCSSVNECTTGCCVVGTNAIFVTKNRCISETNNYPDLEVDFRTDITTEQQCIDLARNSEKGCCVTANADGTGNLCNYGSKAECSVPTSINGTGFYSEKYCSQLPNICSCTPSNPAINLGTGIEGDGNSKSTTCVSWDDSVYWKDSCGNPEGMVGYDLNGERDNDQANGKCDYSQGTLCGTNKDGESSCESVDCKEDGQLSISFGDENKGQISQGMITGDKSIVKNGETWCIWDYPNTKYKDTFFGKDPVGSRHFRSLCINGKEFVEPCGDYRTEYCYSSDIGVEGSPKTAEQYVGGDSDSNSLSYSAARCLKNDKWQTCGDCNTADPLTMNQDIFAKALQDDQLCCSDISNKDCQWSGKCVPAVKPGYKFWENEGADQCTKANLECTATFVCAGWDAKLGQCNPKTDDNGRILKRVVLIGAGAAAGAIAGGGIGAVGGAIYMAGMLGASEMGQGGWALVSGAECFSKEFVQAGNNLCRSMGDCGADVNYQGGLSVDGFSVTNDINKELADTLNFIGVDKIVNKIEDVRERIDLPLDDAASEKIKEGLSYIDTLDTKTNYSIPPNFDNPRIEVEGESFKPNWEEGTLFLNFAYDKNGGRSFGEKLFGNGGWGTGLLKSVGVSAAIAGSVSIYAAYRGAGWVAGTVFGSALIKATPFVNSITSGVELAIPKDTLVSTTKFLGASTSATSYAMSKDELAKQFIVNKDEFITNNAINQKGQDWLYTKGVGHEISSKVDVKSLAGSDDFTSRLNTASDKAKVQVGSESASNFMSGVNAAGWVYTGYKILDAIMQESKEVKISTQCKPWQAPPVTESEQCEKCNQNYISSDNPEENSYVNKEGEPLKLNAFKKCSEYRCKSLGASCELINKGTDKELCVSLFRFDVNPPVIEPWKEGSSDLIKGNISKAGFQQPGFGIKEDIPVYTRFTLGLQTDKPSQCKASLNEGGKRFEEITNFFGDNTYDYFHTQIMFYPSSKNATTTGIQLTGGGQYKLYIRCQDALGNANMNDYIVTFNVEDAPDATAPEIIGTSVGEEIYLMSGVNETALTLFVNKQSECRYSTTSIAYPQMEALTNNKCTADTINSLGLYECKYGTGLTQKITGLNSEAGQIKYVYFKCKSKEGRQVYNSDPFRLTIKGSKPLVIESITTDPSADENNEVKMGRQVVPLKLKVQTEAGAKLDGSAVCSYARREETALAATSINTMDDKFFTTNGSIHEQTFADPQGRGNLPTGTSIFYVGCQDDAGNTAFGNITIKLNPDTTPPQILRAYLDASMQPPAFKIEVNEDAVCKDSIEGTFDIATGGNLMTKEGNVHTTTTPGSNLYYVKCTDTYGNAMQDAAVIQVNYQNA